MSETNSEDGQSSAEDAKTRRALENARNGKGRPAREVLEEIRVILNLPSDLLPVKKRLKPHRTRTH